MNNNTILSALIVGGAALAGATAIAVSSGYNPLQEYATVVSVAPAFEPTQTARIECGDEAALVGEQTPLQAEAQPKAIDPVDGGIPQCRTVFDTLQVESGFDVTYELDGVQQGRAHGPGPGSAHPGRGRRTRPESVLRLQRYSAIRAELTATRNWFALWNGPRPVGTWTCWPAASVPFRLRRKSRSSALGVDVLDGQRNAAHRHARRVADCDDEQPARIQRRLRTHVLAGVLGQFDAHEREPGGLPDLALGARGRRVVLLRRAEVARARGDVAERQVRGTGRQQFHAGLEVVARLGILASGSRR